MSDENAVELTIEPKRKTKIKKRSSSSELTFADLRYEIARCMDYDPLAPARWPGFPAKFHKMVDPIGKEIFLEETDNRIVKFISKSYPPQVILYYAVDLLPDKIGYNLVKREADEIFYWWHSQRGALPERPLVIAEKSDERLSFARLPFDMDDVTTTDCPPLFKEFLNRCSDANALSAFIGSIFFPESYMQQYLYLHGQGQDGKGSLINVLKNVIGEGYQTISPRGSSDRFWFMKTYGKRLCVATDLSLSDAQDFPVSGEIKAMTGGDPIFYEGKGENGFTDESISKILIASNFSPCITGQKSDMRRLIYITVSEVTGELDVRGYFERLNAESKAIIEYCVSVYKKVCPEHGMIPCDVPTDVVDSSEEEYTSIFDKHFIQADGAEVPAHEVRERLRACGIRNDREIKRIKECWKRRYGVTSRQTNKCNFYVGLKIISRGIIQIFDH